MHEINEQPAQPIKVTGPYTFQVGDTSKLSAYVRGGYAIQVRLQHAAPQWARPNPTALPLLDAGERACAAALSNAVSLPDQRTVITAAPCGRILVRTEADTRSPENSAAGHR
jgi:hypothetical protein